MTPTQAATAAPDQTPLPQALETSNGNGHLAAPSSSPPQGLNSSLRPSPSRLPRARRWGLGLKLLLALGVVLAAAAVGTGGWYVLAGKGAVRPDLLLHTVKKEMLQVTIVERGGLESAENNDIYCRVKAKTQGSQNATTIRWVIDDGTEVKAGDKIIELDDSGLQDQLATQQITVGEKFALWIKAEEDLKIQQSLNESAITAQVVALELAEAELAMAVKGQYGKDRTDLVGKLTMARSDLAMWEERAGWSERQSRRGYVTAAQADSDAARLKAAKITLEGLDKQLEVLDTFSVKRDTVNWQGKIDEAKRAIEREKLKAKATEVQYEAARKAAKATYEKEATRLLDIENEIKKCVIYAPEAGMVVYYADEGRNRGGIGTQSLIAQGENVREGQKLMRIPNLSRMVVNTKIHEAMVSRVRGDRLRPTGFSSVVHAGTALNPDLMSGLIAYAAFGDSVVAFSAAHRRAEQKLTSRGQSAQIRVNAFADKRLKGHVKSVGTVASQTDWFAADVKVYLGIISIDDQLEGLKPGMDAEVTIFVDTHSEPVLAVPLQAVLGSLDMGAKRKCYVITPDGPQAREIKLGLSNDTMVEVEEGLKEGEQIVLNPTVLLSEKERMMYGNQPSKKVKAQQGDSGDAPSYSPDGKGGAPAGGADGKGGMPKGKGKGKGGWPKGGQMPPGGFGGGAPGGGPGGG